jgi:hypothetical protein
LRNASPKEPDCQSHHEHVVELADNWYEIRDELNRTNDIKDRTPDNHFGVPRNMTVDKSPSDDTKLPEKVPDGLVQIIGRGLFYLFFESFGADLLFRRFFRPNNAAEADVAHSRVDHLRLARRWPVAQAVVGSA